MTSTRRSARRRTSSTQRPRRSAPRFGPTLLALTITTCSTASALATEADRGNPTITGVRPLTIPSDAPRVTKFKEAGYIQFVSGGKLDVRTGDRLVPRATYDAINVLLLDYQRMPEHAANEAAAHDRVWRRVLLITDRIDAAELARVRADVEAEHVDHWSPLRAGLAIAVGVVAGFVVGGVVGGAAAFVLLSQQGSVVVIGAQ